MPLPRISMSIAIAAAIAARAVVAAVGWLARGEAAFLVPDSHGYLRLASRLVSRGAFLDQMGSDAPELFRTPGFPALLVPGTLLGHPVLLGILLNGVMVAAIVAIAFHVARRVFADERIAGLVAVVVALEPTLLAWSLKVMPETALTLGLVAFAAAALHALESGRMRWVAAAAAALSLAAYVKPVAWPLVFVVCGASVFAPHACADGRSASRGRVMRAAVFLVMSAAILAPWHVRNLQRAGYAGFSTVGERTMYISAGGAVTARQQGRSFDEVRMQMIEREGLRRADDDPALRTRMRAEGLRLLASDPIGYAVTHARGMLRTMFDPGAAEYLRFAGVYLEGGRETMRRGGVLAAARAYPLLFWLSIVFAAALAPLVLLPLVGATRIPRGSRAAFALFALIAAYLFLAGGGAHGTSRFRAPVVPFLALMSACAIAERPAPRIE